MAQEEEEGGKEDKLSGTRDGRGNSSSSLERVSLNFSFLILQLPALSFFSFFSEEISSSRHCNGQMLRHARTRESGDILILRHFAFGEWIRDVVHREYIGHHVVVKFELIMRYFCTPCTYTCVGFGRKFCVGAKHVKIGIK